MKHILAVADKAGLDPNRSKDILAAVKDTLTYSQD
jgi:hypothetical protein